MINQKILLTGGRGPAVLDLARHLSRQGHTVYVAEATKIQYCRFSNAVKKNFLVPDPLINETGFINGLIDILKEHQIDILIPGYDEVYFISKHKHQLECHAELFCDHLEKIKLLNNKYTFGELVKSLGCLTPETLLINNEQEWKTFQQQPSIAMPYLVKSFYASGGSQVITIRKPDDIRNIKFHPPFIVQEFIEGQIWSTASIVHDGHLTMNTVYKPLFVYRENGAAICFQSQLHPGILNLVKTVVENQRYTGLIGFDIMETSDGKLYFIECNPRITNGIHLVTQTDNLSECIFNPDTHLHEVNPARPVQVNMGGMLKILFTLKKGEFKKWWRCMTQSRDAIFDSKDIRPGLFISVLALFYFYQYVKNAKRPEDTIFYDMNW